MDFKLIMEEDSADKPQKWGHHSIKAPTQFDTQWHGAGVITGNKS
jgi:hypothetical protein